MTFGLITEGPTDQVVIRYMLAAFFDNPDIDIKPIQPNIDSTDENEKFGGWNKLLEYCGSETMVNTIEANDFSIIQIDTDICEDLGVKRREDGKDLTEEELIGKIKQVIINKIGQETFAQYSDKIIFAISHGSIECWLLPIYYNNNDRSKNVNCCSKLNQKLTTVENFTIDCDKKKPIYYQKICKKIKKKDDLLELAHHQTSLQIFINALEEVEIG